MNKYQEALDDLAEIAEVENISGMSLDEIYLNKRLLQHLIDLAIEKGIIEDE